MPRDFKRGEARGWLPPGVQSKQALDLLDLALEHERDHEPVDCDRLDQHHAEDEVDEHRARGARVARDARGGVSRGEALADAAAEAREADREARAERIAPARAA